MNFKTRYPAVGHSPATTTDSSASTLVHMDPSRDHINFYDFPPHDHSPNHEESYTSLAAHFDPHGQQTPIYDDHSAFLCNPTSAPSLPLTLGMETPPNISHPEPVDYSEMNPLSAFDFHSTQNMYGDIHDGYGSNMFNPSPFMPPVPDLQHFRSASQGLMVDPRGIDTNFGASAGNFEVPTMENDGSASQIPPGAVDRFRFRVTLENAGTAITKHSGDSVTYLNKSQKYKISIKDSQFQPGTHVTYRSVIGITFDAPQLRKKAAASWQLWKDGRGSSEAYLREGKLQAVEFVDSSENPNEEEGSDVTLLQTGMRTVTVGWSPNATGQAEATIMVRFNCLSTDFTLSKGVAGTPLRLFAETEVQQPQLAPSQPESFAENCYCKVKLFRDHGAERKHQNDNNTVKKQEEKVKSQIEQAKAGVKESGKRRRSDSVTGRPAKAQKQGRSMSQSSGSYPSQTDGLAARLRDFQAMRQSRQAQTLFYLRGAIGEDLESEGSAHPPNPKQCHEGSGFSPLGRQSTFNTVGSDDNSPTPTSHAFQSPPRTDVAQPYPTPSLQSMPSNDTPTKHIKSEAMTTNPQNLASPPNCPTRVSTLQSSESLETPEIEVLGVDGSYVKPEERRTKAVACFYVRPSFLGIAKDRLYRAIYLHERTLSEFVHKLGRKADVDATRVARTIRTSDAGLDIEMDDDTIRELCEGQDMLADFEPASTEVRQTRDTKTGIPDHDDDGAPLILRLHF